MLKKAYFIILVFIIHFLYPDNNPDKSYQLAVTNCEPSAIIANSVNAITGDYFISETALFIQGYEPIDIKPIYISKNAKNTWSTFNHLKIEYIFEDSIAFITEPNGAVLIYDTMQVGMPKKIDKKDEDKDSGRKNKNKKIFNENTYGPLYLLKKSYEEGLTNCSNSEISGRLNIKNNQVSMNLNRNKIIINCANGTIRKYERFKIENLFSAKFCGLDIETNSLLFNLKEEILPNKNKIIYIYDKNNNLIQIKTTNFKEDKTYAILNAEHSKNRLLINSNDNKNLIYEKNYLNDKFCVIKSVQYPEKPTENYQYVYDQNLKYYISQRNKPENRDFEIEYYTRGNHTVNGKTFNIKNSEDPLFMRVKSIKSRAGINGELIENYKFIYNVEKDAKTGFTEVYDVNNVKTIYRYSNLRLDSIERYDEKYQLKNKEILSWGKGQDATKDVTFLLSKTFLDSRSSILFHKEFIYDDKGNIIKENFYGNLSGKNKEISFDDSSSLEDKIKKAKNTYEVYSTHKTYSQDNRNLLISDENDNRLKTEYAYIDDSDLIKSKIIKYNNEIKIRYFYEYNEDFVLTKEIIDDGQNYDKNDISNITLRLIKNIIPKKENPFINIPEVIEEKYLDLDEMQEKLIKKTNLTYSNHGKVIKEEIYSSKNIKAYSIERKYNEKGNLIEEIDPEGYITTYDKYDDNFNLLTKKESNGKTTNFEYDFLNRLIKKEEIPTQGKEHSNYFSYDSSSNLITATDHLKKSTNYRYDFFNNLIETIKPQTSSGIAIINSKYDGISREIETKDAKGNAVKKEYNSYNLPIEIIYPDKTKEKFVYNLDGTLKKHIDQLKTVTTYEYDFFQRVTKKTITSPDNKNSISEEKTYSSFNLLSQKDFDGNIITYEYDYAGRKISEKILSEETRYLYDDLSRLSTAIQIDDENSIYNIEVKDYLNRLIEERKEDINNNILFKIGYEYDSQNNKTKIIKYIQDKSCIENFKYDSFNRPIEHIDAQGNIDSTEYIEENNLLQIKHIDPVNLQTLETFDSLNRIILQEKRMFDELVAKEEFSYDLSDNLMSQKSTIINLENKDYKFVEIKKIYDEMNRLKTLIEAFKSTKPKQTSYFYTKKGKIFQIIKPNKIYLTYEYDYLNNNTRLYSSQTYDVRPIDYEFTYNNLGFVTKTKDNISGFEIKRTLDNKGRILKETFLNFLKIENIFDKKGNKVKQLLPDRSFIEYNYNPYFLKNIIKKDPKGIELYRHEFSKYDLNGNLLEQNLINNTQMQQQFDELGRKIEIQTPYFTQTIDSLNPDGTIKQMSFFTFNKKDISNYEYDPLKQIIKEEGLFTKKYSYDSHNNRLKKDNINYEINDLNQVLKTQKDEIIYDENGNPIHKHFSQGDIYYKYDALDRLVSIKKPNDYELEFEYDAFNRRLSKKYVKHSILFSPKKTQTNYLYDDQNEIGSLDMQNNFKELRILSNTQHAEIGSSIAFEIDNNIYVAIHDLQGNVASLVTAKNDVELYRYSAFGEEKIYFNRLSFSYSMLKNNWRFSSKRKDESNLIYFGRRYYDSEDGRWLTCDPQGFTDGLNLYAFVLNDPLIKVDLYGLSLKNLIRNNYSKEYLPVPPADDFPTYAEWLEKYLPLKDHTRKFDLQLPEISQNKRIGFINGIRTTSKEAYSYAKDLSKMAGGYNIHVTYNETYGFGGDKSRAYEEFVNGYESKAVKLLKNEWKDYLSQNDSSHYLQICHSEGAIIAKNALFDTPKQYRDRIEILAIAPGAYINKEFCNRVRNFCSEKDFIPRIDWQGKKQNIENVYTLTPHPNATWFDHNFDSSTYYEHKMKFIQTFLNENSQK